MEIFQRAAVATADVTLCVGRLRTLVETWPPAQNGYGVLTDAPAVLAQVKEAHTALTAALETLQKTQWPVREDYEAHREAKAVRQKRGRR
jgi:hypothetical protein